jgi:protein-arginine kinase activator protein McsA
MNCENCGTSFVERIYTERYDDTVEDVYVCEECPAEFVVRYGLFEKKTTNMREQEEQ